MKINFSKIEQRLAELNQYIFNNPELGYQEFKACQRHIDIFTELGFDCSIPYPDELPTAFKVEYGSGFPTVVFMSEYDALKDLGHACGHNLIATAAAKAFLETANYLHENNIGGKIILLGTPAEENFGGKVDLINNGAFDGVDLALISHPHNYSCCSAGAVAVSRYDVIFEGKSAHASLDAEAGINALDAMISFFNSVGLYRQQMDNSCQVHGIISQGGVAPNIIPDYTEAFFYLRADDDRKLTKLAERFAQMVQGAALATGCKGIVHERKHPYTTEKINLPLKKLIRKYLENKMVDFTENELKISSDYANVSQIVPTANVFFNITKDDIIPLHSTEFYEAAISEFAFEQALKCGEILSEVAIEYFSDRQLQIDIKNNK
ncbi:amidohydrolase [Lentisphaerota bacterium WC36G]|nr:amidohydrolase [Lentisphaerae bacterium WC36]